MPSLAHFWAHFFPPKPVFTEANLPGDLSGKVYVVTGANTGIGKDIARLLYAINAKVYILCRSADKALKAIQDIETTSSHSKGSLIFIPCDLADLTSVKAAADAFLAREKRLDVLFNNAGVMVGPTEPSELIPLTTQGHELCLGVNCVATHLLTRLLTPTLVSTEGLTRIVWYSSFGMEMGAHQDVGIRTDNLDYHKPELHTIRYSLSKTGAWALCIEHDRRYRAQGVASVPIDPGNVVSELARDQALQLRIIAWLLCYPTIKGAYTALYAGFSPETVSDQADWTKLWVAPFGRLFPLRPDLTKATLLEEDGGTGGTAKFWSWCEAQIQEYV
ncbi:putative short-chain dehydrogenase protein [Rosellinia necatrix]|uniref:Putative short-chain dehydrogenase protein n=1 Tax=Rosellinia necatrix TaxID=77044 RepID=A0A1W2TWS7_ROSNE|nr:putative short-chain dehydrogenase protein [Rosellinia necatrix]